jgi:2-polyprenyl-3-methyl-5-hydroxy-6-metoxy-1,4-benzoquinol methylase
MPSGIARRDDVVAHYSADPRGFADRYYNSSAFRQRLGIWASLIFKYSRPDIDALDVGCGAGTFTGIAAVRCRSAVGIDASEEMIALARSELALPNTRFEIAYLEALPSERSPVGLVLCSSVLEYVEDFETGLRCLAELTIRDGHLIVSIPNAWSPYRWAERASVRLVGRPRYFKHVRHLLSPGAFRKAGERRGLRFVEQHTYGVPGLRTILVSVFARD